jgi:hypothetical protein
MSVPPQIHDAAGATTCANKNRGGSPNGLATRLVHVRRREELPARAEYGQTSSRTSL